MSSLIRIRVKLSSTNAVQDLSLPLSSTVRQLKQQLSERHHYPPDGLIVFYGGEELVDNRTLEACHLSMDVLLTVELRQVSVKIPIVTQNGSTVVISAETDWSVSTLKEQAARQVNALPGEIHVLENGDEVGELSRLVRDLMDPGLQVTRRLDGGA